MPQGLSFPQCFYSMQSEESPLWEEICPLEQIFNRFKPGGKCLSIFDGERYSFVLLYFEHNTRIATKPLDKGCFRNFCIYWDQHALLYFDVHKDDNNISKLNFRDVFALTWEKFMSQGNMKSGCKATGTYPVNPLIIPDEAFSPKHGTSQTPDSSAKSSTHSSFTELFLTPFRKKKTTRNKKPAINSRGLLLSKRLLQDIETSKQEKGTKKNTNRCKTQTNKENSNDVNRGRGTTKKILTPTPAESWYCTVCGKNELKDMKRRAFCGEHIHED
ncbi:hypothetical protein PR048_005169, partial [Dryococelus australis]